jgi:hypothetical protein
MQDNLIIHIQTLKEHAIKEAFRLRNCVKRIAQEESTLLYRPHKREIFSHDKRQSPYAMLQRHLVSNILITLCEIK